MKNVKYVTVYRRHIKKSFKKQNINTDMQIHIFVHLCYVFLMLLVYTVTYITCCFAFSFMQFCFVVYVFFCASVCQHAYFGIP